MATSALQRIEALYAQRQAQGALRIADSILADTDPSARHYVDALYWRGLLTEPASKGRLDLIRVVLDHPLSPRAGDALYQLARQDLQAGDQAGARRRLEQAMRDYTGNQFGAEIATELGRLLMAAGESRSACAAFDSALARLASTQVERRNEVAYLRRPCDRLMAEPTVPDSSQAAGRGDERTPPQDSGRRTAPSGRAGSAPAVGRVAVPRRQWSAQVAAFTAKTDAQRSAARLTARGYEARVTAERPFRVRVGRFTAREDAVATVKKLQASGTKAIVVEAERP